MNIQQFIKTIISWIYINIWDEETLGLHFGLIATTVVKPFVFAYVCGEYVAHYAHSFERLIEPKTPEFKTLV